MSIMNRAGACSIVMALGLSMSAAGASLRISPVSIKLEAGQQAAGITLANSSERPLVAQVRVFLWTQDVREDLLTDQKDLVVSPPIVTLGPNGEQLVRVVRLDHTPPGHELTYRLLIDELPDSAAPPADGGVDIRLRYSVPLFIGAAHPSVPALRWSLSREEGFWSLQVENAGGTHAQLSAVRLVKFDGDRLNLADGLLGYALAGSVRQWRLPIADEDAERSLRVYAVVNGMPVDAALAPDRESGALAHR
jgi:fimbrial chaperone protein